MAIQTINWVKGKVRIIDQAKLPLKFEYLDCGNVEELWQAIKGLKVRGAPAIGIAGAFGVALAAANITDKEQPEFKRKLNDAIRYLASSRPTAVNLFWALKRMQDKFDKVSCLGQDKIRKILLEEAKAVLEEDKKSCRQIGAYGAGLIDNRDNCITICNAGALATADYGTALGVFYRAKERGRSFKVYSCETRPLLQGARLSSWELRRNHIDVTLIADNTIAALMQREKIDKAFVGADRIASNGDTANKIGTMGLAILCYYHKVPFYVAAPSSTFDFSLDTGKDIPIEYRGEEEVTELCSLPVAPGGVKAYNPAFDVTGNKLITAFITEKGLYYPPFKTSLKKLRMAYE